MGAMDNHQLDTLLKEQADQVHQATPGHWQFDYFGRVLIVLTDESMNRMRIITPVVEVGELDAEAVVKCLSANFDRALDARYAINGEFLWSAFIHPLRELHESQVVDALMQVATLAVTYGVNFSSSGLTFGAAAEDPSDEEPEPDSA